MEFELVGISRARVAAYLSLELELVGISSILDALMFIEGVSGQKG